MKIDILYYTPLEILMRAIRVSHDSTIRGDTKGNKLGKRDKTLLGNIIQNRHDSVLEHLVYTIEVSGVSRAMLYELTRHRFISLTVESTRFTLKRKFKDNVPVENIFHVPHEYLVIPFAKVKEDLKNLTYKLPNDITKYLIPDAFLTHFIMTSNARELAWMIYLRSQENALLEFRQFVCQLLVKLHEVHPDVWRMLAERDKFNCQEVAVWHLTGSSLESEKKIIQQIES